RGRSLRAARRCRADPRSAISETLPRGSPGLGRGRGLTRADASGAGAGRDGGTCRAWSETVTTDPREGAAPPATDEGVPGEETPPPARSSPDRGSPEVGTAIPAAPPKRRGRRLTAWLAAIVLVLSLGVLAAALTHEAQQSAARAGQLELVSRVAMLSQRLSRQAREAAAGAEVAFAGMEDSRAAIDGILAALERGDAGGEVAAVAARSRP